MVVYSGDGLPVEGVVESMIPSDWEADVLLNECTFSDERQDQAEAKSHCSLRDAVGMMKRVRARYLILTHFSQRYPKSLSHDQGLRAGRQKSDQVTETTETTEMTEMTEMTENVQHVENDVREVKEDELPFFYAHDLMQIEFADLPVLCKIRDMFENCFIFDDDEK